MSKQVKHVYFFGCGKAEGNVKMKELLGRKGANLAEMTNLGVPVPPGFTITSKVCSEYHKSKGKWPKGLIKEIDANLTNLEKAMNAKFGDPNHPLLVSIRSGSSVSMPGLVDTMLNIGINDQVVAGIIKKTGNDRFAYDIYRRFINMFGDIVMGCNHEHFEHIIDAVKKKAKVQTDYELNVDQLKSIVEQYKNVYEKHVGEMFPQDVREQLKCAVNAAFNAWHDPRSIKYRQLNGITDLLGTAVNVQAMVFGNLGDDCSTGVVFTRNPSTGQKELYGEFLVNAQGEDVVAGIRIPEKIEKLAQKDRESYRRLVAIISKLEENYKDMQDVEFTIQNGELFILQCRTSKRTANAAVKVAVEMLEEGLISEEDAVLRLSPDQLYKTLSPVFDQGEEKKAETIAVGLPASSGVAVGSVVLTSETAKARHAKGEKVIFVCRETTPEDIDGMDAAEGIITALGGMTSHTSIVARGMGKCCVTGVGDLNIDYAAKKFTVGGITVKEGESVSMNGSTGAVYAGRVPTVAPVTTGHMRTFMMLTDKISKLNVRANAETSGDAKRARDFGAEGIGLCRTEQMFFGGDRSWVLPKLILALNNYTEMLSELNAVESCRERKVIEREYAITKKQFEGALESLFSYQRSDFEAIFRVMTGLPVTIRLLDPPLHEYLPCDTITQVEMARRLGVKTSTLKAKIAKLIKSAPMLGHRGCYLAFTYPEIYRTQIRAIIEAALNVKRLGKIVLPEIMIPQIGSVDEFRFIKSEIIDEINKVFVKKKATVNYLVGAVIEVPRAALTADEIATEAQFFSFETNDLTQLTAGFSRDDCGKFLGEYISKGIYKSNPFQQLDQTGVGKLVQMATILGRKNRRDLKIGICGEHGSDPESIEFFHRTGLDYVSCSPFQVPIAKLAAAQAAVKDKTYKRKPLHRRVIKQIPKVSAKSGQETRQEQSLGKIKGVVWDLSLDQTGQRIAVASSSGRVHLMNAHTGTLIRSFNNVQPANCVSVCPLSNRIATGYGDGSVIIWNVNGGRRLGSFMCKGAVDSISWTIDGQRLLCCSKSREIHVKSVEDPDFSLILRGHHAPVRQIVTLQRRWAVSCSVDHSVRVWDVFSGNCTVTLTGHTKEVNTVAVRQSEKQILSGSDDWTIRLWDMEFAHCLGVFEGHEGRIWDITVSPDGCCAASASADNTIKIWELPSGVCLDTISLDKTPYALRFSLDGSSLYVGAQGTILAFDLSILLRDRYRMSTKGVRYSSAKVVLLGESGIGKSCLAERMINKRWVKCKSTHGLRVLPLKGLGESTRRHEREVWLWDLAGQPEYRLIHQLFLDHTSLGLVLFDPRDREPFKYIPDWEKAVKLATRSDSVKILVAAKADQIGKKVGADTVQQYLDTHGYTMCVTASARTGYGCSKLLRQVNKNLPWERIPSVSTRLSFKKLRDAILALRRRRPVLRTFSNIEATLHKKLGKESFTEHDLYSVLTLLGNENVVRSLRYADLILLRPEVINNYASALLKSASNFSDELGGLSVSDILEGKFELAQKYRLRENEERLLMPAVLQLFQNRALCIRVALPDKSDRIVFPSQCARHWDIPRSLKEVLRYNFIGHVRSVYTTLTVLLAYSGLFKKWRLWQDAAMFEIKQEGKVAILLRATDEGTGCIKVYFGGRLSEADQVAISKYVQEHLEQMAGNISRTRYYICRNLKCRESYGTNHEAKRVINTGKNKVRCSLCKSEIPLLDEIERACGGSEFQQIVRDLRDRASITIDNYSKEMILVGEMTALAAKSGQIFRTESHPDVGIDGSIEFRDMSGRPTGKRVYVQLKHGDSYLRQRHRDGETLFDVKKRFHLDYWRNQAYPVYLVIRSSSGKLEWMNITEYLQNRTDNDSLQIIFTGEPLTDLALIRLRNIYVNA